VAAPIDWNGNPDSALYRETYTTLAGIRARHPALRSGSLIGITSSDDRVAAFARVLPGEQTMLIVINFSDSALETRLDLSPESLEVSGGRSLSDLLENARFTVPSPGSFTLMMGPYQPRIFLLLKPNTSSP